MLGFRVWSLGGAEILLGIPLKWLWICVRQTEDSFGQVSQALRSRIAMPTVLTAFSSIPNEFVFWLGTAHD